jgi:hypothetical protein
MLGTIAVAEDIERSGRYQPLRLRLYQMGRECSAVRGVSSRLDVPYRRTRFAYRLY